MSASPRQAIILAAGLGTRLRPLTNFVPKPILPVGGVPILLFNLFLLKRAGVREITVNLHHRPEKIRRLLGSGRSLGLKLRYSLEPQILGTAGGIAKALAGMRRESVFVLNGDIIMDLDLAALAALHRRSRALATLACIPQDRARVKSFVEYDAKGRIFRIAGEPPQIKTPRLTAAIFSGIHLLEPELFAGYPPDTFACVIRQIYQPALARGKRLQAYRHRGSWWDLGSLEELQRIDRALWERKLPRPVLRLWEEVQRWA
ncbi:MAG TPA: hypothetical protein DF383_03285 [Deltaproteobacteria bacterium]|nr:hypothetical protein [Deltaproteobacteria bacterium]